MNELRLTKGIAFGGPALAGAPMLLSALLLAVAVPFALAATRRLEGVPASGAGPELGSA